MKIAFISSLFGNRGDRPANFKTIEGFDYYLFTDQSYSYINQGWNIYNISENKNISDLTCNIRKSRYAKFMGWELLQSLGKSYDFLYYCDSFYTPNPDSDWIGSSKHTSSKDFPFLQDVHDNINVRRLGIIEECKNIVASKRDSRASINKTIEFFKNNYPDINLSSPQYFQNTMFGYNPNSETLKSFTEEFWDIYISNDITYRDQPLWNLLLLKNNLVPTSNPKLKSNFFKWTGQYGNHSYC